MRRRWPVLLTLTAATACSEDPIEAAAFAEHCGVAAPVRLLELSPGQVAYSKDVGDRIYHTVGTPPVHDDGSLVVQTQDTAVWSTGPCGESPRRHEPDFEIPFTMPPWPELLLACKPGTGIVIFDPDGGAPQHTVFAIADCNGHRTDFGLVVERSSDDAHPAGLLLYPYPADPRRDTSEPVVLLSTDTSSLRVRSDRIHALTPDRTLVRIDLATRSVTEEQTHVRDFGHSADGRHLIWRDATVTGGDAEWPAGIVSLRDLTTNLTVALGQTVFPVDDGNLGWIDHDIVRLVGTDYNQLFRLPDFTIIDLPPSTGLHFEGPTPDGLWPIGHDGTTPNWLGMLDLADGSITPLFSAPGQVVARTSDHVVVLTLPLQYSASTGRDEAPIWAVPLDGAPARRVAARATRYNLPAGPDQFLTAVDMNPDRLATLLHLDLVAGSEQQIDDHVWTDAGRIRFDLDTRLVTYNIVDGPRSGVWRARLP